MSDKFIEQLERISGEPNYITGIVLDDKRIIGYRPKLNQATGSVIRTLILCQAMYWAGHGSNPFYKFREPCNHRLYKEGDSWCEELGLTLMEYRNAIDHVCQAISKKVEPDANALIWRWTDMSRLTWYMVNWNKVNEVLDACYNPEKGVSTLSKELKKPLRKSQNNPFVIQESPLSKSANQPLVYKDTETTSKNTQRVSSSFLPNRKQVKDELLDLGLDEDEVKRLIDLWEPWLLHQKVLDVKETYANGKVGNLLAYVKKVFSQRKLYAPQEKQEICRKWQDINELNRIDVQNKLDREREDKEEKARLSVMRDLVAQVTPEKLQEFEEYLAKHKAMVLKKYKSEGLNSLIVRAMLGEFLYNAKNIKE